MRCDDRQDLPEAEARGEGEEEEAGRPPGPPGAAQGEAGGDQATVLLKSGGIAALYQALSQTLGLWREEFSTTAFGWGNKVSSSIRLEFHMLTEAAIVGLGYIIGLRYALVIACGSFLSWYVMTPMIGLLGKGVVVEGTTYQVPGLAGMETGDIFYHFVRPVGIGAIAMAGLMMPRSF